MIEAHGLSDVGRVRKGNEDSFACDESLRLFIVADGMGGHNAGEVASRLAVEAMVGFIKRTAGEGEWSLASTNLIGKFKTNRAAEIVSRLCRPFTTRALLDYS